MKRTILLSLAFVLAGCSASTMPMGAEETLDLEITVVYPVVEEEPHPENETKENKELAVRELGANVDRLATPKDGIVLEAIKGDFRKGDAVGFAIAGKRFPLGIMPSPLRQK